MSSFVWILLFLSIYYHQWGTTGVEIRDTDPSTETGNRVRCGGVSIENSWDALDPVSENPAIKDKSKWKPFHTAGFHGRSADAELVLVSRAMGEVHERLRMIKTWPLVDLRMPRLWDRVKRRCVIPSFCGLSFTKFYLPCVSPDEDSKETVREHGIPADQDPSSYAYQQAQIGTSLVLFFRMPSDSKGDINSNVYKCESDMTALSKICYWDKETLRPTHAQISLCADATQFPFEELVDILTHQILHILSRGTMLGYRQMRFAKYTEPWSTARLNDEEMMRAAQNITWSSVRYEWSNDTVQVQGGSNQSNPVHVHRALVASSDKMRKTVQEYFGCDHTKLAGAETSKKYGLGNRIEEDDAHWSMRLFPDELMTPIRTGAQHLSKLTLTALEETGWYEVDMSIADGLIFDMSTLRRDGDVFDGCKTASGYCHNFPSLEVAKKDNNWLDMTFPFCARSIVRKKIPTTTPGWGDKFYPPDEGLKAIRVPRDITPDVFYGYTHRQWCSEDGRYRMVCKNYDVYTDGCPVYIVPLVSEHLDADCRNGAWQTGLSRDLGLSIGPKSTCVRFTDLGSPYLAVKSGGGSSSQQTVCLEYDCTDQGIRLLQKRVPFSDESKRIDCWTSDVCGDEDATHRAVSHYDFVWLDNNRTCTSAMHGKTVCPNYRMLCGKNWRKVDKKKEVPNDSGIVQPSSPPNTTTPSTASPPGACRMKWLFMVCVIGPFASGR